MFHTRFFCLVLCFLSVVSVNLACKGCVELDEYNFNKVLSKFKAVLVKFDIAYPYGEQHDTFSEVSKDIRSVNDLIFAQVGIKDYGDKDNEELGKKYGIQGKDDLPALRLFVDGKEPISPPDDFKWNEEYFKGFLRDNTGIYIGLQGCLEEFDKYALEFIKSSKKEALYKKALKAADNLKTETDKKTAVIYTKYMNKVIEKDTSFINQENLRLNKLLKEGKINENKKTEIVQKLNILKSFKLPKDEL
ncbi:unnamed protein product [Brassicogethes aeneus]|uniref:Endoplasmic reticulum resident protein 29 n=1 Tax=Brassicogethes aeneus TaxID=1431903 RepID=A0A9P0AV67_BRAAE|nr:unnamed protein product [Brassicogethes aeneus]